MGLIVAEAQPSVICVARAEYRRLRKRSRLARGHGLGSFLFG